MALGYDAIVIGTGQAGPFLALRLAAAGRKVAILERSLVGGTCVNVGCIPSKTLIASARAAHVARTAAAYGVEIGGEVGVDMVRVKARKDAVVRESSEDLTKELAGTPNLTFIRGHGRFEGPHTVRVNGDTLEAPEIFINVGARARVPDFPGLAGANYRTNSGMMRVDFLPDHLVIVGGSYIGLEFAQMFRRFGSRVTVVEKGPRILGHEDDDVCEGVQGALESEGVSFRVNAECVEVSQRGREISVFYGNDRDGRQTVTGSDLLVALGRVPNTDDLGLDRAGIATDAQGYVIVDDELRTNVRGVWALGDVNRRGGFTHTSYNDFEIVAANLLDGDARRVSDRIPAYGLYVDPPLGRAGMSEREARASRRRLLMAKMPMTSVGRARERGETQGFMKVIVDADNKRIVGATLLGIGGDEVVHSLLDVMYARVPFTVIRRAMHIHPTVSELVPTLLGELKPLS